MSMSLSGYAFERAVLENTVAELAADGFRVVIRPKRDTLPTFFQGYQPDVVAYKDNKNLAIDIIAGAHTASSFKLKSPVPSERFAEHPGWERRVVYARPANSDADIPVASKHTVYEHLDRLEASIDAMGVTAALLIGWAVFEAAARTLMPSRLARPQSPGDLIEALAFHGWVTPDEADLLRRLSTTRNEVAHGRLDLTPSREDVALLIDVTRTMLEPED